MKAGHLKRIKNILHFSRGVFGELLIYNELMNKAPNASKVKDILSEKVIAFHTDHYLIDVVHYLNKYRISSAPVVNEQNEVIGYLSEEDCIKHLSNALFYDEAKNDSIEIVMTRKVKLAKEDWDIFELEQFFVANHLQSAPVVDSENHLLGIVTRRDILIALEKIIQAREEYKKEIKTPVEINMHQRIKMILNNT